MARLKSSFSRMGTIWIAVSGLVNGRFNYIFTRHATPESLISYARSAQSSDDDLRFTA